MERLAVQLILNLIPIMFLLASWQFNLIILLDPVFLRMLGGDGFGF